MNAESVNQQPALEAIAARVADLAAEASPSGREAIAAEVAESLEAFATLFVARPAADGGAELVKRSQARLWVGASTEALARDYAAAWGRVVASRWAGPGHYRSDVYIVDIDPDASPQEPAPTEADASDSYTDRADRAGAFYLEHDGAGRRAEALAR